MAAPSPSNALWHAFRQGDDAAFQQLYRLHAKDLLRYGHKVTHDVPLIEDSIHDLFIELWQRRATLADAESVKFYLFRSLRYKINHALRRDPLHHAADFEAVPPPAEELTYESQLIEREGREQLFRQLRQRYDELTPRQREALNLRFYQHFSNEEIARIMGVNYQSACRFIYSGLKALREAVRILSVGLATGALGGIAANFIP